jgi:hypothetical protein
VKEKREREEKREKIFEERAKRVERREECSGRLRNCEWCTQALS